MHPDTARFFAVRAQEYREKGDARMQKVMEDSLSACLLNSYDREVEAECERALSDHHARLRESEGDPFGGVS